MTSSAVVPFALVTALTGCLTAGARLSPAISGCYRVKAGDWTHVHARVTGFRALPDVIALDTARLGRILVPNSWRLNDPPSTNRATLNLYMPPWRWYGDTLQFDLLSSPHPVGNDSVIVVLSGWGGSVTVYLERQTDGFAGTGFFAPHIDPGKVPGIRFHLRPGACPSGLNEGFS